MMNGSGMMAGGMWIGMLLVGLVIILVIFAFFKLLNSRIDGDSAKHQNEGDFSLIILNERLAKGEIQVEEYNHLRGIILKSDK
ncbi:hypothetical protein JMA_02240 [Jeotgalibacillus malaysiensis]|uniref:SHOCT domain-containing protein n=1 Tax=Jeotgalibacillus malaysiensis TaxID=1508404 RepID=A0A0B5AHI6_9BACL|nr:hypothetical protein [Jeotgalibacillus malaysiensis]AJD89541.1 hypothetical protein JMA_02240 [Jeotgalibacillus malaysiensis]